MGHHNHFYRLSNQANLGGKLQFLFFLLLPIFNPVSQFHKKASAVEHISWRNRLHTGQPALFKYSKFLDALQPRRRNTRPDGCAPFELVLYANTGSPIPKAPPASSTVFGCLLARWVVRWHAGGGVGGFRKRGRLSIGSFRCRSLCRRRDVLVQQAGVLLLRLLNLDLQILFLFGTSTLDQSFVRFVSTVQIAVRTPSSALVTANE